MMSATANTLRICVIGAGAAGLAAMQHISSTPGLSGVVYESSSRLGGVWVYQDKPGFREDHNLCSPLYRDMITNLPKEIMGFLDYPFKNEGNKSFITHAQVLEYLEDYASHFQLKDYIKFNKRVTCIKPILGGTSESLHSKNSSTTRWSVTVETTETNCAINSNSSSAAVQHEEFDAVFVCTGHFYNPSMPQIENMDKFEGEILHSRDYRVPHVFKNKRVVVVGTGPSGTDISLQIAQFASQVIISCRREFKGTLLPSNMRVCSSIKAFTSNSVIFKNYEEIKIHSVVFCTGYKYDFPFAKDLIGIEEGKKVTPLYRHMIHIKYPTLCFIGIPFTVLPFITVDCQVRFALKYLQGVIRPRTEDEMNKDAEEDAVFRAQNGLSIEKAHYLGPLQWQYYQTLAEEADFLAKLKPVFRKIYDTVGQRRTRYPTVYKNDLVRIIDEDQFEYTEAPFPKNS